jgi:hypothetical protein
LLSFEPYFFLSLSLLLSEYCAGSTAKMATTPSG